MSKSKPIPFQVRMVYPWAAFAAKYSTRLAASCRPKRCAAPCHKTNSSVSPNKVAAHEIPSGRQDLQLRSLGFNVKG